MKKLLCIFFLALPLTLMAWWDTPHMAIAEIAYARLKPEVRAEVDRLIACLAPPTSPDFITSACWADDFSHDFRAFWSWHSSTLPYDPEGILSKTHCAAHHDALEKRDALFALNECLMTLQNKRAQDGPRSFALRFFTHLVGDLHQPIHCTTLYSSCFPCSDHGGTLFPIQWGNEKNNLHAFWDSGCGLATVWLTRPLNAEGQAMVHDLAVAATAAYPECGFTTIKEVDFATWRAESYALGVQFCYQGIEPETTPSKEYQARGQKVCLRQIALAGYRLAYLLNSSLGGV